MWFLWNRSSYSFETCTIVIGTAENFRVHWVWPSKYKGKWCFSPKCGFSETNHHTALKSVPLWLAHLKTSGCTEFGPLNTKESDVLAQNVVSLKQIIIHLLKLVPLWMACLKTSGCMHWVWPSKYKGKWCFSPKCGFSETDHHTALKFVPLWLDMPENLRCTKYKGKWCFAQNVVSLKQIIIQLWKPLWLAPENFQVHWVWPSKYKGKWCFCPQCGF